MSNYLLEIGTEELPAGHIPEALAQLEESMAKELKEASLGYESLKTYATPRRLAIIVKGLDGKQPTTKTRQKGPPVNEKSFDANGNPLPPATKFAEKHGLKVEQLDREVVGKDTYLFADVTTEGREASEVLCQIIPKVIMSLSFERPMRWGSSDLKFSRPIRWIVSLLDSKVVSFELPGRKDIKVGNETEGHRILAPGSVVIGNPDEYKENLRAAKVIVDQSERRERIEKQVKELAASVNGKAKQITGPLLEEVINITEWPSAVIGQFSPDYLSLPGLLLETIMVHHQRYFPVEKTSSEGSKNGAEEKSATGNNLLPHFITIANNDLESARAKIAQGNERVLRARLADGKFFYFDDQKIKLTEREANLGQLTFQKGLGSYKEKAARLTALAQELSQQLSLPANISEPLIKTARMCKLDLVTNLVGELPELQGYVGSWYAEKEGAPPEVVQAIASHYSPRHTEDGLPADTIGKFAAVIDKLDHLCALFALRNKPKGSSDPFALRRNAQGLTDILVDGLPQYPVNIVALCDHLLEQFEEIVAKLNWKNVNSVKPEEVREALHEFLLQRLRFKLESRHEYKREVIDAVLEKENVLTNLADADVRCRSLERLISSDGGFELIRAGVRVSNILKADSPEKVDRSHFTETIEGQLWDSFNADVRSKWETSPGSFRHPVSEQEYDELLALLRPLSPLINKFFDDVMVNDEDKTKRDARHGILKNIDRYFSSLGSFKKLQPILPSPVAAGK